MATTTDRLGELLRRPNAPEKVLHLHRDLPLLVTVGVERGIAAKLATSLVAVWGSLPEPDKIALSTLWESADTVFVLAELNPPALLGKCVPEAAAIVYSGDHVATMPRWLVQTLAVHEMSHSLWFQRSGGRSLGSESEVDRLTSGFGYGMSTARSVVNRGAWR
jgi:hypothetical protein